MRFAGAVCCYFGGYLVAISNTAPGAILNPWLYGLLGWPGALLLGSLLMVAGVLVVTTGILKGGGP